MKIRFLSSNPEKIQEVTSILGPAGIEAIPISHKIEEIQSLDVNSLLREKAIQAFKYLGRPVFVEHTGLYTDELNDFPAGLTQIFWDTLEADKVAKLFVSLGNQRVTAKTHIGYVDSKKIHTFEGSISGSFSDTPRGSRNFQWDCVFIPDGKTQTFAEMGAIEKNKISMRKLALDKLIREVKVK